MIADQQRARHEHTRTSSGQHLTKITPEEWEFVRYYRQCSPADQDLIFRALEGDDGARRELEARQ